MPTDPRGYRATIPFRPKEEAITEDERSLIGLIRDLGLDRAEATRRLVTPVSLSPSGRGPYRQGLLKFPP